MDPTGLSFLLAALLLLFLALGLWIAPAMLLVAAIAVVFFTNTSPGALLATTVWAQSTEWALTALPLFVWMGEILFRTKLADDMFNGLAPWVSRLPGRLVHVNVLGCGLFAAVSGSSTATTATIGRINLIELRKRGYQDSIVLGSLAGSGTLGILIPPSIIMIVYGVAADVPITHLFIAGVLPGILLMALFSGYIMGHAMMFPDKYPAADAATTLVEKLGQSRRLIPIVGLILAGSARSTSASPPPPKRPASGYSVRSSSPGRVARSTGRPSG